MLDQLHTAQQLERTLLPYSVQQVLQQLATGSTVQAKQKVTHHKQTLATQAVPWHRFAAGKVAPSALGCATATALAVSHTVRACPRDHPAGPSTAHCVHAACRMRSKKHIGHDLQACARNALKTRTTMDHRVLQLLIGTAKQRIQRKKDKRSGKRQTTMKGA